MCCRSLLPKLPELTHFLLSGCSFSGGAKGLENASGGTANSTCIQFRITSTKLAATNLPSDIFNSHSRPFSHFKEQVINMAGRIQRLEDPVINKIAAGEVIY